MKENILRSRVTLALVTTLMISSVVHAQTYTGPIEYEAGTGSNQAKIAIDFDLDVSFLFTYRWDGTATGWDALDALDAGSLDVFATDWGEWGMFVNDFDYPGAAEYDYGLGANTGWAYYNSIDNENWSLDMGGVSFRNLNDGDWDSWVWTNYSPDWFTAYRTPGAAPIPEPATLMLLAIGSCSVLPKIRRQR